MAVLPTGDQYELAADGFRAVVTEVGATLRSLTRDGRDLIVPFAADEPVAGGRGQQLLPWPNRIRDGRYEFGGAEQQLSLSEPARHNAIHGLVRHVPWNLVEHTSAHLVQRVRVYPRPGWPGVLEAEIVHRLGPEGMTVEVMATNIGESEVPYGYAAHPYLTVGQESVDDITVSLPAASYLEVDNRLLPVAIRPATGPDLDFRVPRPLGTTSLDTAFTGLARDHDGAWRVRLSLGERHSELWAGPGLDWLQVFTGGPRRDLGLAVEPMTCGPDAFNTGPTHDDVVVLVPGESTTRRWGITGG